MVLYLWTKVLAPSFQHKTIDLNNCFSKTIIGVAIMKFNYNRIGYYRPDYFCGILPKINESRHEFKIRQRSIYREHKGKNIEDKVREQGKERVRGPHISTRPSTEGSMQKYC